MKRRLLPVAGLATALSLAVPASALADSLDAAEAGVLGETAILNTLWVVIAAVFVLLMLAGLLCLEAGMSRMKNVGTLVPEGAHLHGRRGHDVLRLRLRVRLRQR